MKKELEHFWWEKKEEGYEVDPLRLLFSINLHELCVAEVLHMCNSDHPDRVPREVLIEIWKAEILNLRKLPKMLIVRAAYYQWFNPRGSTRETYPERWKAAWDLTNYYFNCDLDTAWSHLTSGPLT